MHLEGKVKAQKSTGGVEVESSAAAGLTAFMAASGPKQSDSQHSGDKTSFCSFDVPN